MKTNSIIKHTASLLSTVVLFALPAHAVQNFNKTQAYTTGDSDFGAVASFNVSDNEVAPSGATPGSYAVTATGSVVGKVLTRSVTALSGTGTVKALSNGTGTFSGNLSALGISLFNVSNRALPYVSSHYIRDWSFSKSIPFSIAGIPFNVTGKVKASVDAYFRVDTTYGTSILGGIPKLDIKMGPVADMAASAEASVGVGIDGIAEVSAGASGSLRLGKVALTASAVISPTYPMLAQQLANAPMLQVAGAAPAIVSVAATAPMATLVTTPSRTTPTVTLTPVVAPVVAQNGAQVTVSLTLSTAGINGSLDLFAEVELWPFGSSRATHNLASYSSGSASVNILGPVTYTWF